ncbi:hypothetical protein [Pseudonocardia phyllosphaerae]|uniref:hypothetical protein n=1 Tax=Pseudonocardia phyllosphaerae TaxID=3390502 RepID=UPI00397B4B86
MSTQSTGPARGRGIDRTTATAAGGIVAAVVTLVVSGAAIGNREAATATIVGLVMVVIFGAAMTLAVATNPTHRRSRAASCWAFPPVMFWVTAAQSLPWPGVWLTVLLPVTALACYGLGRVLAGPDRFVPAATPPPADAPRLPLADGERVLWSRSMTSHPALLLTGVLVLSAVLEFWLAATTTPATLVVAILMSGAAARAATKAFARVRIGADGVVVEQPWLRTRLAGAAPEEILVARAVTVDPAQLRWTDYGVLNTSRVLGFRATRRGEALALDLTGDREFLVTVPDAATAAGLVNTELDRRRAGHGEAPAC